MGALGTIAAIVIVLLILSVRMAQEYQRAVIFRLGRLKGHRGPGLYLLIPLVERQVADMKRKCEGRRVDVVELRRRVEDPRLGDQCHLGHPAQ